MTRIGGKLGPTVDVHRRTAALLGGANKVTKKTPRDRLPNRNRFVNIVGIVEPLPNSPGNQGHELTTVRPLAYGIVLAIKATSLLRFAHLRAVSLSMFAYVSCLQCICRFQDICSYSSYTTFFADEMANDEVSTLTCRDRTRCTIRRTPTSKPP